MTFLNAYVLISLLAVAEGNMDDQFERLAARYVDEFPALSPVNATSLGDHRFDSQLDEVDEESRKRAIAFYREFTQQLGRLDGAKLCRAHQVDYALLEHHLRAKLWELEELQEWAWNPLIYVRLCGKAVYNLMARDFAPQRERLIHVADRLEKFPRLYEQIRETLDARRVPRVHTETAIKQNRGLVKILDNMVAPHLGDLSDPERDRLLKAMAVAKEASERHQKWLETELLPSAGGDFRLGAKLYHQKLAFTLHSPLDPQQVHDRAVEELKRVRAEMYEISKAEYAKQHPYTRFPTKPSREYQQAIIRAGLELANRETPPVDRIVEAARESLKLSTDFVRSKDLITIPPDPVEIIVMPEFQRGVTLAYCDSPGTLDVGQKTFYAVSPFPKSWSEQQVQSMLREYNTRSLHNLTIHEAMPGHFVQLAHSNRYPSKLRGVLSSGVFIEGWAVYTEKMMVDAGFLDGDPLMRLVVLKWYLRAIANAILDQAIHTDGITREQGMRLMMEDTFQEEREAAGKWTRAQLTSSQLSTYFVGFLEHTDMRQEAEAAWGDDFDLKTYHDRALSFGSPPVKFVRALLLDKPIPQRR